MKMDNNDKVTVLDEAGNEVEATIINVIEVNNQEYLLYSIDVNDEDANLYVNKIIKDENGEEDIVPIEDDIERNVVFEQIKKIMNEMN